jgi:hypothetical protein
VDEDDTVFQQIIKAMSEHFRKEPTEENPLTLEAYPPSSSSSLSGPAIQQQQQQPRRSLSAEEMGKVVDIILKDSNSYVENGRNDFVYGLSGHLFHNGITESSTTLLVRKLCNNAKDEEVDARVEVVAETYKKGKTGKPIRGISQLKYLLAKYNEENEARVNEIITQLNEALNIVNGTSANINTGITTTSPPLGRGDDVAEAIVELAESNGDIFFKDRFGQPYAVINSGGHIEVVSMDSKKFAYHLRGLLKSNKNKRIISNDSLEKAVETLKSDAILEGRTIPLHLRVAWKKKNEVIYYDLTDESCAIQTQG